MSTAVRARVAAVGTDFRVVVGLAASGLLLIVCVAALLPFRSESHVGAIALVMLIPPLASAGAGLWPSVGAAIVSGLVFNFFFTRPYDSLRIDQSASVAAFVVYVAVAVALAVVASRLRDARALAERRQRAAALLQLVTVEMIRNTQVAPTLRSAMVEVVESEHFRGAALSVTLADEVIEATAGHAGHAQALVRSLARSDARSSPRLVSLRESEGAVTVPIATTSEVFGFLVIDTGGEAVDDDRYRTIESFAGVVALALARAGLAEEAVKRRSLEETDRLRTALLQSVSHDLRTPLTAVKATASALREAKPDAATTDAMLADIEDEADRLARLVSNLLDLSRIESGALDVRRRPVPVDELVYGAVEAAASRTAGHPVEVTVPPGLPAVEVDEQLVRQVLGNLLENAAELDASGRPIGVHASLHPRRLELRVVDHGPGVPEAERHRIFEPYQRLKAGTRRRAGTGLGLVICRGFVEAHGGSIRLETTLGGGATFVVSLPTEAP